MHFSEEQPVLGNIQQLLHKKNYIKLHILQLLGPQTGVQ